MTPQPKSRTIGCWLVLDDHGDTWRVQCLACDAKTAHSKRLLQSAIPPRCKCGGKVASKPPEPAKSASPAVVPVQVVAAVSEPRRAIVVPRDPPPDWRQQPAVRPVFGNRAQPVDIGAVYGRLTILQELEPTDRRMVEARCTCGQIVVAPWGALRTGNTRSCGCLRREVSASIASRYVRIPVSALPGERFGKLVVLHDAPKTGRHRKVTATCDCGVVRDYDARTLVSGGARSCGCSRSVKVGKRKHAFPGMVYRYLTVVGDSQDSKKGHRKVDCLCICGKTTAVFVTDLVRLRIASCGCQRWLGAAEYHRRALRETEG